MKTIYEVRLICEGCQSQTKFWTDEEEFAVGKPYHPCEICEGDSATIFKIELIEKIEGEENVLAYWKELLDSIYFGDITEAYDFSLDELQYINYTENDELELVTPHRFVKIKVYTRNK